MTDTHQLPQNANNKDAVCADNQLCWVWRHARWYIAIENGQVGLMFQVKPTERTEIRIYQGRQWGYEKGRKVFSKRAGGRQAAMAWMVEFINSGAQHVYGIM